MESLTIICRIKYTIGDVVWLPMRQLSTRVQMRKIKKIIGHLQYVFNNEENPYHLVSYKSPDQDILDHLVSYKRPDQDILECNTSFSSTRVKFALFNYSETYTSNSLLLSFKLSKFYLQISFKRLLFSILKVNKLKKTAFGYKISALSLWSWHQKTSFQIVCHIIKSITTSYSIIKQ